MQSVNIASVAATSGRTGPTERSVNDGLTLTVDRVKALWWTLCMFLAVRLVTMVTLPITDTTESRYIEMARKMVETGRWLAPQDRYGVPFWGKPPLSTWLSASGMELFGVNAFAARLPVLLVSLGILWLVYIWVRSIAGRNTALVSLTVLFSMATFFGASAFVMTDMPMAFGTTLAMVGFWNGICRETPHQGWGLTMFAGLAIGLMAKGPVALVLFLIPSAIWLTIRRDWTRLPQLPWGWGMALVAVLTIPWYAAAEAATPGFLRYFLIGEHIERFLVPGWSGDLYGGGHHFARGSIWVFWTGAIRPWSYVALLPLLLKARSAARTVRSDATGWLLYLLLWAISPLILFTLAANILPAYTIPGLPASAILMVVLYTRLWPEAPGRWRRYLFALGAAISLAFFGTVAVLAQAAPDVLRLKSHDRLVAKVHEILPDAPIYRVGIRSFSSEFYTGGKVRLITLDALKALEPQARGALSVPTAYVPEVAALEGYRQVGEFGRGNILFLPEARTDGE